MKFNHALVYVLIQLLFLGCKKNTTTQETPDPPLTNLPTITTLDVVALTYSSTYSGIQINNRGTTRFIQEGIVWGPDSLPTVESSFKESIFFDTSYFTFTMNNLSCSTKYFIRAFAITTNRDTIYGNQLSFISSELNQPLYSNLHLSKIFNTDTTIYRNYVYRYGNRIEAILINRLKLPEGINIYAKIDSGDNIYCNNGVTGRVINAGDTIHFGPLSRPGDFPAESSVLISQVASDPPTPKMGKYSVHVGGKAITTNDTYFCRYYDGGYGATNTTHQSIFIADTSGCVPNCRFQ